MKLAIVEPLGVNKETMMNIINEKLGDNLEIDYYADRKEDTKTLVERSSNADVVMISNIPYSREIMEKNSNLKMICVAFTGVDHIDMDYCRENNILVSNASGYANVAVAELVMGMIVTLARNIIPCDKTVRSGGVMGDLRGFELRGKTFGIIGLGAIGRNVAKLALAFGCKVMAYNRSTINVENVEMVTMETLLKESDIVSLHVPLNESTRGLIGKEELDIMKKDALLINAARGPIVDNNALAKALNNGDIAGAGIDVFDMEPPIPEDYPLLDAPNTVLTPHIAFATDESMIKRANIALDNIKFWSEGKPQNVVK